MTHNRIQDIITEWRKGCSNGAAGECNECTQAAMKAVWNAVIAAEAIDFRDLLKRYIDHVGQAEGFDFTDTLNQSHRSDVKFTTEEVAELQRLANPLTVVPPADGEISVNGGPWVRVPVEVTSGDEVKTRPVQDPH